MPKHVKHERPAPVHMTIGDLEAELPEGVFIRGNTNQGVYEIVTPTGVHPIDREKVTSLTSKAELRAYIDSLMAV